MIGANGLEQDVVADYLEYFGLDEDPFQSNWGALFDGANRRDQFESLIHLCQFNTSLVAVVGEAGIGKRTFQRELCDRLDASDIVIEIEAPVLGNAQQFLIDTVKRFNLPLPTTLQSNQSPADAVKALVLLLSEFGATSEEGDPLKILVVENAHHLDDVTLQSLVKISQYVGSEHRSLHIVLFGELELRDRLAPLTHDEGMVQIFELQNFNQQELKAYLRFRLESAGFSGIFPFKEEDIQFLWDISQGVPAAIHDAAREILLELATPAPAEKRLGLPIPHMVIVITLAAALLGVLLYSSDGENVSTDLPLMTDTSKALPTDELKTFPGNSQFTPPEEEPSAALLTSGDGSASQSLDVEDSVTHNALVNASAGVAGNQPTAPTTANELTQSTEKAKTEKPVPAAPKSVPAVEPKVAIKPLPKEPPAVTSRPEVKPVAPKVEAKPLTLEQSLQAQVESEAMTSDERQLLERASSEYTLQVLAGASRDAVDAFVSKQSNRNDLRTYAAYRNGKTNYIVVAGSFGSSDAAKSGIELLPDEQRRAGAWPRSVQSVQADIKEYRKQE